MGGKSDFPPILPPVALYLGTSIVSIPPLPPARSPPSPHKCIRRGRGVVDKVSPTITKIGSNGWGGTGGGGGGGRRHRRGSQKRQCVRPPWGRRHRRGSRKRQCVRPPCALHTTSTGRFHRRGGSLRRFVCIECAAFVIFDANGIDENQQGCARILPEDAQVVDVPRR
jgi:hypothetical protein